MMWFFAVLIVLALGAVAVVAAGWGTPMTEEYDDRPDAAVPADRDLEADDLRRVRFSLAFRGYRASEVDALLDRLASEMRRASDDQPAEVGIADPGHAAPADDGTGRPD
jgi:DivIVA domain-containing protein